MLDSTEPHAGIELDVIDLSQLNQMPGAQRQLKAYSSKNNYEIFVKNILKQSGDGSKKVATLKNSQTFGEMALLDEEPRSATGVAAEETIIFFLSKESLINIADDHPKLGFQILWKISKLISRHLRKTTGKLVDYLEK